jgi:hypothetical protein
VSGGEVGLYTFCGDITLTNSTVSVSSLVGVEIKRPNASLTVTNSTISNNPGYGVLINDGTHVSIINSTTSGNSKSGIVMGNYGTARPG